MDNSDIFYDILYFPKPKKLNMLKTYIQTNISNDLIKN